MKKLIIISLLLSLTCHAIPYESQVDFNITNYSSDYWQGEITTLSYAATEITQDNYKTMPVVIAPYSSTIGFVMMPRNLFLSTRDVMEIRLENSLNIFDTLNWATYKDLAFPGLRTIQSVNCTIYADDFFDLQCQTY